MMVGTSIRLCLPPAVPGTRQTCEVKFWIMNWEAYDPDLEVELLREEIRTEAMLNWYENERDKEGRNTGKPGILGSS